MTVERIDGETGIIFVRNFCHYDRILNFCRGKTRYYFDLFGEENAILYCEKTGVRVFYPLSGVERLADREYRPCQKLHVKAEFAAIRPDKNVFVLDTCKAKLNEIAIDDGYTVRLNEILNKKISPGDELTAEYTFRVHGYRGPLQAVAEDNLFLSGIFLNGNRIFRTGNWFYDRDFLEYDLSENYREGENTLVLRYRIPDKEVDVPDSAFENIKNKFCEAVSLENIVLRGDFSVKGKFSEKYRLDRKYFSLSEEFIAEKSREETIFERPFYRGRVLYKGSFSFDEDFCHAFIKIPGQYPVLEGLLNGKKFISYGGMTEITEVLKKGNNTLEITLFTSDRNLMGPHHYFDMDSEMVSPDMYAGKKGWFDGFNLHIPQCRMPEDTFSEEKYILEEFIGGDLTILFN